MSSDHKGRPAQPDPPVRLVPRVQPDPPVRKEAPASKVPRAHRASEANLANEDPTVRRDRQALCAMSKDLEMPSRAMRAKCWLQPFARKVPLPFKGPPPVPNVPQQPA